MDREEHPLAKFFIIPHRVIVAIMGCLAIVNAYTMRVCLSLVITQLVVPRNYTAITSVEHCEPEEDSTIDTSSAHKGAGTYEWSEEMQGTILSSFYIGYFLTHIPGGVLADRFGAKWTLSLGILSTAIFTLVTPLSIDYGGAHGLIAVRILMGLGEGTTFPALSVLISKWVPRRERAILGTLVLGGGQVGMIFGNTISGILLVYYPWPVTFYFFAIVSIIWFVIFTFLCFSDPASNRFMKNSEKDFLEKELGTLSRNKNLPPTPWKAILTSPAMLALLAAQVGHDWAFFILITDLPKYMHDVLRMSVKSNGIFTSLPYLLMWIVSLAVGFLTDYLIHHEHFSITNIRKLNTVIAASFPAVFMVAASYAECDHTLVIIFFILCLGTMGCYYSGMKLSPLDMSPNYSGTLMAITNGLGSATGVFAPYCVGVMTPNATMLEWRVVFWVTFVMLNVTALIYVIWASGEVQPFDNPERTDTN